MMHSITRLFPLLMLATAGNPAFGQATDAGSLSISEPSVLGLLAAAVIGSILALRGRGR